VDDRRAGKGPTSRRTRLRLLPTPTDVTLPAPTDELWVEDAPPLSEVMNDLPEPRIADLDALLREVDDLRGTLRRDLTLAATAVEAGADDLAGWVLLGEDGQVRQFEERALAHLRTLEQADSDVAPVARHRRVRRMLPAAPLVAACAALFGFLGGGLPSGTNATSGTNVALSSYTKLTDLAISGASDRSITEAADQFHEDLAPLVAAARTNPAAAEKAIALLQGERAIIAPQADTPALQAVLRRAEALVAQLRASLPRKPARPLVLVPAAPHEDPRADQNDSRQSQQQPRTQASASASASPKPASTATSSPSARPSASPSASPSARSSSSASPSSDSPLSQNPVGH
jgi:hypothetical protein